MVNYVDSLHVFVHINDLSTLTISSLKTRQPFYFLYSPRQKRYARHVGSGQQLIKSESKTQVEIRNQHFLVNNKIQATVILLTWKPYRSPPVTVPPEHFTLRLARFILYTKGAIIGMYLKWLFFVVLWKNMISNN